MLVVSEPSVPGLILGLIPGLPARTQLRHRRHPQGDVASEGLDKCLVRGVQPREDWRRKARRPQFQSLVNIGHTEPVRPSGERYPSALHHAVPIGVCLNHNQQIRGSRGCFQLSDVSGERIQVNNSLAKR